MYWTNSNSGLMIVLDEMVLDEMEILVKNLLIIDEVKLKGTT